MLHHTEHYQSATCAPNLIEIGAQEHSFHTLLLFGAKKKNTKKIR